MSGQTNGPEYPQRSVGHPAGDAGIQQDPVEPELGIGPRVAGAGPQNLAAHLLPIGAPHRGKRRFEGVLIGQLLTKTLTNRATVIGASLLDGNVRRAREADPGPRVDELTWHESSGHLNPSAGAQRGVGKECIGPSRAGSHRAAAERPCNTPCGLDQAQVALSQPRRDVSSAGRYTPGRGFARSPDVCSLDSTERSSGRAATVMTP